MPIASLLVEVLKESVNSEECDLPIDQWRSMQSVKNRYRTTDGS